MELNVLNEKLNVDVSKVHDVTEFDFWHIYTTLLNVRKPILSDKDCLLLAHILTIGYDGNVLEKQYGKQLEQASKIKLSNLFAKCRELHEKGFLVKGEVGYSIHPSLLSFAQFVKQRKVDFKFTIPLHVT